MVVRPGKVFSIILLALCACLIWQILASKRECSPKVILIPVGDVGRDVLSRLGTGLSKTYGLPVLIGNPMPAARRAFSPDRRQYSSTMILEDLARERGATPGRLLAVVEQDLYAPGLNFVFGEASGRFAVLGLSRMHPRFYGMPEDDRIFERRALTEAVHELGHAFGMRHCRNPKCVMSFSNNLADTDRKGMLFCDSCRRVMILRIQKDFR